MITRHTNNAPEAKTSTRYPDWQQHAKNVEGMPIDISDREAESFIKSLPNSADVVYYLQSHHNEARALQRMSGNQAVRMLIEISHKTAKPGGHEAPRTTNVPPSHHLR